MSSIEEFKEEYPSLDSYWRSIILFGRNVASYKFALAKSLLELSEQDKTVITLDELSEPFSRYLCEHIVNAPKQATSGTSQFLDACRNFNSGTISKEELLGVTVKKGFNNVIDAFHVVNSDKLPVRFYEKDYQQGSKKIILTDEIYKLVEMDNSENFVYEAEARWNLVQTAWGMGVSRNLLSVSYNEEKKMFFVDDKFRRRDITSARDALNGYQKGRCFYCSDNISVEEKSEHLCDVDHFFPHTLQPLMPDINLDGVWNLVLACKDCNRGEDGKFAKVPDIKYLTRLFKRNEFLISSHHPLRETLIVQTGQTIDERRNFLKKVDYTAVNILIHRWKTNSKVEEVF